MKKIILSSPLREYGIKTRLADHNFSSVPDHELSIRQHDEFARVLMNSGFRVQQIPELIGHPNSVFVRDPAVCCTEGYIQLRMGLPSRRGEERWISSFLDKLMIPLIRKISGTATAEGGDIIACGRTVFIGQSSRTNREGTSQLSGIFSGLGFQVRMTQVPRPYLHLGGAMSVLDGETILTVDNIFPDDFLKGFKVIRLPSENFVSGNVISNGRDVVIVEHSNLRARQKISESGFTVISVNLSEFIKGTGGPSCLILPVM